MTATKSWKHYEDELSPLYGIIIWKNSHSIIMNRTLTVKLTLTKHGKKFIKGDNQVETTYQWENLPSWYHQLTENLSNHWQETTNHKTNFLRKGKQKNFLSSSVGLKIPIINELSLSDDVTKTKSNQRIWHRKTNLKTPMWYHQFERNQSNPWHQKTNRGINS